MSAKIHFVGAEPPLHVSSPYDKLTAALTNAEPTIVVQPINGGAATVYKAAIAYVEDVSDESMEPMVGGGH